MEIGKKYGCLTILGKVTNLITNANVNAVKYIISMKKLSYQIQNIVHTLCSFHRE